MVGSENHRRLVKVPSHVPLWCLPPEGKVLAAIYYVMVIPCLGSTRATKSKIWGSLPRCWKMVTTLFWPYCPLCYTIDLFSCLQSCAAEHEVWEAQHYDPKIFKTDPGGIVYQRYTWDEFSNNIFKLLVFGAVPHIRHPFNPINDELEYL